jgi:hypothetical protein
MVGEFMVIGLREYHRCAILPVSVRTSSLEGFDVVPMLWVPPSILPIYQPGDSAILNQYVVLCEITVGEYYAMVATKLFE